MAPSYSKCVPVPTPQEARLLVMLRLHGGGCGASKPANDGAEFADIGTAAAVTRAKQGVYEPRYISLDDFVEHGRIPRCGSAEGFEHPTTHQPNAMHLLKPRSSFDLATTIFIFCSHRWLKPGEGAKGHPDDLDNSKYKLLLELIKKLTTGPTSVVPEGFAVALWIGACRAASEQHPLSAPPSCMRAAAAAEPSPSPPLLAPIRL